MKRSKNALILFVGLIIGVLTSCVAVEANCKASDPVGHFEGVVGSKQAGNLQVSLDLKCDDGKYQGALGSPIGTFSIKDGNFETGKLILHFDAEGAVGTIEVNLADGLLKGRFVLADDSGSVELKRIGDAHNAGSSVPSLAVTEDKWREDLNFFKTEIPKRHANAFHFISRERFAAEIASLELKIGHLNGDEMYVGLDRIANLIGDGHTYVDFPDDWAHFPIIFRQFGDEYRVVAVAPGYEKALGTRLLKVEDTPIDRAHELLRTLTPADETKILSDGRIQDFLANGLLLHGLGIIRDRNSVRYTMVDDANKEFAVQVHALSPEEDNNVKWTFAYDQRPLFRQKPGNGFWYVYLADSKTVYCSFRDYNNLESNASDLLKLVNEQHPEKLVIDMRLNSGGDYNQGLKYLIEPIRALSEINRTGHLFVIIGPATFSAAMSNSAQFHTQTSAILVGQTIGEKPNSYQEVRQMKLPNSNLTVRFSTKYYKFIDSGENLVRPDKEIIPSWTDYKSGRDPVLEWILTYSPTPSS